MQQTISRHAVTPPLPIHFGAYLKMLRDRHGITQAQVLTNLAFWDQSTYSRVEKDKIAPSYDQLAQIYEALRRAGVELALEDRQRFLLLARRKIESMKTRHEHKSEAEWDELRVALARVDHVPAETESGQTSSRKSRVARPRFAETRHLVGRMEWLASIVSALQGRQPKKLVVIQGPVGIGKSSELHRLASCLLRQDIPRYHIIPCELPVADHQVGPDLALDELLGTLLVELGPRYESMPLSLSLEERMLLVLGYVERTAGPVIVLLDNAENLLDERGVLAACWEQFLVKFLRCQHQASLVLATTEWHGWLLGEQVFVLHTMLPPLAVDDGILLLQQLGLGTAPVEQLRAVVEAVGGVPQCLEWVASLVQEPMLQDEWDGLLDLRDDESDDASGHADVLKHRLQRLLSDSSLFGGPIATKLTPLLKRIIEQRLSSEARAALTTLAVAPLPLGKPALQVLCERPAPLKELRDASLLVAYPHRVQLLPMVASAVLHQLSASEVHVAEEQLIRACTRWLDEGTMSDRERGTVLTELVVVVLKHGKLLAAAELLLQRGWLSFAYSSGYRLAKVASEVMSGCEWHAEPEQEWGGLLLQYVLGRFRGEKASLQERGEAYQRILAQATARQVQLKATTISHLVQHIANHLITTAHFAQAQALLDSSLTGLDLSREATHVETLAPLLKTKAHGLNAEGEHEERQGHRDEAHRLREEALGVDRHCIELLRRSEAIVPRATQGTVLYHLARTLNEVGYFLVNLKRGEEAMEALEESIRLKRQGYAQAGSLAMSIGEMGQALALVGRFQEALHWNEEALQETGQLAASGHATAQNDLSVHLVNRAGVLLRVGQLEEAERLVNTALSSLRDSRGVYRDKAREMRDEIEDCRTAALALGREYLDWRWYARYKQAIAFDVFGWLTHAGPFSPVEQDEWDRLRDGHDEQAQTRREQLIKASRDRELEQALFEQREPRLLYPALQIEEVQAHLAVLLQLSAEISEQEPNAIVKRLYLEAIEEQVDYLHMVEATFRGDSQAFWEHNRRVHAEPTSEEMETTLGHLLRLLQRGMRQENTAEVSASLLQALQRVCAPATLQDVQREEGQDGEDEPPVPAHGRGEDHRLISPAVAKQFFEAVLAEYGFSGWHVQLDHAANNFRIEANVHTLFLPAYKDISVSRARDLLGHELEFHVLRAEAGKRSPLALLAEGTKNFLTIDEGMAVYYDQQTAQTQDQALSEASMSTWIGTLATGLAAGVKSRPQTFHQLYRLLEPLYLLDRLLSRKDQDLGHAQAPAHRLALNRCLRTYRGVPDLRVPGICYAKDAIYVRGYLQVQQALKEDPEVFDRLMVGKIAYEHLQEMRELGITMPSMRPRWYAHRPDLDEYILSFGASGGGHVKGELREGV